mmetsp:Transcript_14641/g.48038  ORF Transcript_14641/g.48038 Transcript_14641/m.48038 type:complete len:285 (+) Transcript_14641:3035-3889(+)
MRRKAARVPGVRPGPAGHTLVDDPSPRVDQKLVTNRAVHALLRFLQVHKDVLRWALDELRPAGALGLEGHRLHGPVTAPARAAVLVARDPGFIVVHLVHAVIKVVPAKVRVADGIAHAVGRKFLPLRPHAPCPAARLPVTRAQARRVVVTHVHPRPHRCALCQIRVLARSVVLQHAQPLVRSRERRVADEKDAPANRGVISDDARALRIVAAFLAVQCVNVQVPAVDASSAYHRVVLLKAILAQEAHACLCRDKVPQRHGSPVRARLVPLHHALLHENLRLRLG